MDTNGHEFAKPALNRLGGRKYAENPSWRFSSLVLVAHMLDDPIVILTLTQLKA